jgi:hypothetical protein
VEFRISISGPASANWRYYIRVDSEAWSYTGNVSADVWTTTLYPGFFSGSRLSLGGHFVERQARDNSSAASNTISLSYTISAPSRTPSVTASGGLSAGAIAGIVVGAVALVGVIVAVAFFVHSREARAMKEASAMSAPLMGGIGGAGNFPGGAQVYGVQPPYPPPFQPAGAYAPSPPQPEYPPPYPGEGVSPYAQAPYGGPRK